MSVIVGAVLLVAAVVLFIVQPMIAGRRAPLQGGLDEPTETEFRRRVTLLALRDAEYDYATGKLDEQDYSSLRRELAAEALAALEQADTNTASGPATGSPELEAEIARLRGGLGAGTTCAECGSGNETSSRFCSYCGAPLHPGPDDPPGAHAPGPSPA